MPLDILQWTRSWLRPSWLPRFSLTRSVKFSFFALLHIFCWSAFDRTWDVRRSEAYERCRAEEEKDRNIFGPDLHPRQWELENLMVVPEMQRQGVGRQLLDWGVDVVRKDKDMGMDLPLVLTAVSGAAGFYKNAGCARYGGWEFEGLQRTRMVWKGDVDTDKRN